MAAGERGLDCGLARAEPVERAIELALVDGAELEQPAQAGTGGIGGKVARGGELGGGRDQTAGNQSDRQRHQALVNRLAAIFACRVAAIAQVLASCIASRGSDPIDEP